MTDEEVYDLLAAAIFFLVVGMFILSTISVAVRATRWFLRKQTPPALLIRDLITFGGLSMSFMLVAAGRVMELPTIYTRTIPWLVTTSAPALVGLAVFLWFEFRVIGHRA